MKTIKNLKKLGLSDDEILNIAMEERLLDAVSSLRLALSEKWVISILEGIKLVKAIKEEL